ncbi:hypothetical protein, partial [Staphylococcus aureus]
RKGGRLDLAGGPYYDISLATQSPGSGNAIETLVSADGSRKTRLSSSDLAFTTLNYSLPFKLDGALKVSDLKVETISG